MILSNSQDDTVELTRCRCVSRTHKIMMCLSSSQDDDTACRCVCQTQKMMIACRCVCRTHKMVMCLSSSQYDSMSMCLSNSQDDDRMSMCLSNSQDDDSMPMCVSNSQDDDRMSMCLSYLVPVWRSKKWRNFIPPKRRFWKEQQKMKSGFRSKHFSRA